MTETDTSRGVVEKIGSDLAQFGCLGEQARHTLRALLARAEMAEAENQRLRYVLDGVAAAIDTGRNEPLQIWRDQIEIAREAIDPTATH